MAAADSAVFPWSQFVIALTVSSTVKSPLNKGINLHAFNKPIIGIAKLQDLPPDKV